MKIDVSIVISLFSLMLSMLNLWFAQRTGKIRMTNPNRVQLYETAITFDTLLYCSSTKGRPLEYLTLVINGPNAEVWLRDWVWSNGAEKHREKKSIFVPSVGIALENQWFTGVDELSIQYDAGDYELMVYEPRHKKPLFKLALHLTETDARFISGRSRDGVMDSVLNFVMLDWNPRHQKYEKRQRSKPTSDSQDDD